jgi:pilus assembly protein CpaB
MRPKSIALLLLALGCGLVASIGITEVMSRRNADPSVLTGETQPIFVAMADIGLGDQLSSQVLKLEPWPKDKVPVGAISRIADVEGRRARTKLYAGEPILENKLLGKGASGQGATALIPKGYRVVPVKVDMVSGGSSLILPGDRVDIMVYLVRDPGREIPETSSRTILQDIKVFAVDDVIDLEKEKDGRKSIPAKTISLLVTPEQAAKVTLASEMGKINLVMRSPEDDQQAPSAQARPRELFGVFGATAKAERSKETLVESPEPDLNDKTKRLLGFLDAMKGKLAASASPPAEASKPRETWVLRMLKPAGIAEVTFEKDVGTGAAMSPFGPWRVTSTMDTPTDARPTKAEPKLIVPPAQEPPAPPTDAAQPKKEPKETKIDKA